MTSDAFKDRARRDPAVNQSAIKTEVKVFRRSWSRVGSLRLLHGTWENWMCWAGRSGHPSVPGLGGTGDRGLLL